LEALLDALLREGIGALLSSVAGSQYCRFEQDKGNWTDRILGDGRHDDLSALARIEVDLGGDSLLLFADEVVAGTAEASQLERHIQENE